VSADRDRIMMAGAALLAAKNPSFLMAQPPSTLPSNHRWARLRSTLI